MVMVWRDRWMMKPRFAQFGHARHRPQGAIRDERGKVPAQLPPNEEGRDFSSRTIGELTFQKA